MSLDLPYVKDFLFLTSLRTGSIIIAVLGIVHPAFFACTFFMRLSYMIVTIWVLIAIFCIFSCVLLYGILKTDPVPCEIWVLYTLIFVCLMFMLLCMLTVHYSIKKHEKGLATAICGILWYVMTVYFIIVVNSYCKDISNKKTG